MLLVKKLMLSNNLKDIFLVCFVSMVGPGDVVLFGRVKYAVREIRLNGVLRVVDSSSHVADIATPE